MDNIEIRKMRIEDYDDALRLWKETEGMGLRSLDDSREGISKFLARNPDTCFICREKGEMAGIILCGNDGRRGYIYHTAVSRNSRRKGIGTRLVDAALEGLDREGIKKAALVVFADNQEGNMFWEKSGFARRDDLVYRNRSIDENNV